MVRVRKNNDRERGAALVELAICATVFLTVLFGVIEFGRALWVHNALSDAARRGARYAINHPEEINPSSSSSPVKNVVVFGDPDGGTKPLVDHLSTDNVVVKYSNFGLGKGTVTVSIKDYDLNLSIPLVGTKIPMRGYSTTLTGENVGLIPKDL